MNREYNKSFVIAGLIMIMMGLLAPMAHKHAAAPFALLQAHVIGEIQALLFFALAFLWPTLKLPRFSLWIASLSLQIGLWTNFVGTLMAGILGAGREQYIANQERIPGYTGLWNEVTVLLIGLSAYALVTLILALWGVLRRQQTESSDKRINMTALVLFVLIGIMTGLQTLFPEYANF